MTPREHKERILVGLNSRQREAVTAISGPVLVIAGPGSGKTKALTHRVAYLVASGVPPARILAVTFTNRAAAEMRERVSKLLMANRTAQSVAGDLRLAIGAMPFIGTFHGFSASLLRREAGRIGYRPDFTIYDEDDRMAALKEVMKELAVPKHVSAAAAGAIISDLKADLVAWDECRDTHDSFGRTIARIYRAYQERLRAMQALDFDDLLFFAARLLRQDPTVLRRWRAAFSHIHIDEYQDTAPAQYELMRLLAGEHKNVFAIGDDAQSIYSWRRADYRIILNFEREWPEARVILLEENYRSTPEILSAANRLIAANRDQKPKTLWTRNPSGIQPVIAAHGDGREEAEFIAEEIVSQHAPGRSWGDIAVLYRTNAQSRAIEEALLERTIPYRIIGGIRFYQRREIKDLLAYLRYLIHPEDALALKRIINVPARGIGPKTVLAYLAAETGSLSGRERHGIERFERTTNALRSILADETLAGFLKALVSIVGYERYLADSRDGQSRIENVGELISMARKYDALPAREAISNLLEEAALLAGEDDTGDDRDRVRLMTLHAAKGLEFPTVFMAGLEEGLLPHAKAVAAGRGELEEERRLAYVGMTRAKKCLYLTWAVTRTIYGEQQVNMPSRFLRELPPEIIAGSTTADDDLLIVDEL